MFFSHFFLNSINSHINEQPSHVYMKINSKNDKHLQYGGEKIMLSCLETCQLCFPTKKFFVWMVDWINKTIEFMQHLGNKQILIMVIILTYGFSFYWTFFVLRSKKIQQVSIEYNGLGWYYRTWSYKSIFPYTRWCIR